MEEKGPSLEHPCLKDLRAVITGPFPKNFETLTTAIQAADLVEEAGEVLRSSRREVADPSVIEALMSRLAPLSVKAQARRSALWHLDSRRALVRLRYAKEEGALGFDDGDVHAIFLQAFRFEGLRLALDLGKRPRFLLSVGTPLPAGVGGQAEIMDAVLQQEPAEDPESLMARLNNRLPEGLRIHGWDVLPGYASAVADLALLSHWRWEGAKSLANREAKVSAFLEAETWLWDRATSKSDTHLDLRTLVPAMRWEDSALCISTRMGAHQAVNPLKVLGAIFDLDPASVTGLIRTGMELKADARVSQGERFEPKLKNMYEDAVLLGGGPNIVLVDEDDDEPIRLG
jgi:radical SAM-linked protein